MTALKVAIGVACCTWAVGANAGEPLSAQKFREIMLSSTFPCELRVGEKAQQESMYGVARPEAHEAIVECLSEARDLMKVAYTSYLEGQPADPVKTSAKSLYAAALSFASAVASARTQSQLDRSEERSKLRAADADFQIEANL